LFEFDVSMFKHSVLFNIIKRNYKDLGFPSYVGFLG